LFSTFEINEGIQWICTFFENKFWKNNPASKTSKGTLGLTSLQNMALFQHGGAMTRKFSLAFAYTETCKSKNFQEQNKSKKNESIMRDL